MLLAWAPALPTFRQQAEQAAAPVAIESAGT
jgi:hypothetical protein